MTEKTIIELAREKAETRDHKDTARCINAVYSYHATNQVKAVATLAILNGERTYSAAFTTTRAERLQLIGLLDELKAALLEHQDQPLIERLPSK